jgi:5-methylcytosine-specific restriction endonuclease McrA
LTFLDALISEAVTRLRNGQPTSDLPYWAAQQAYELIEAEERAAKRQPSRQSKKEFRSSIGWRRTRYKVLAANAKKYGGVPKCVICGRGVDDGVRLEIDHQLPISTDEGWQKRFQIETLRVTCQDCNAGRLNKPINGL